MVQFSIAIARLLAALRRGLRHQEIRARVLAPLMYVSLGTTFYSVVEGGALSRRFGFTTYRIRRED